MKSSAKLAFIFCHGWGFTPQFWQPLQGYLSSQGIQCYAIDLGYENDKDYVISQVPSSDIDYVGVGHSLGLIKLLNLPLNYRALIGLQSFVNFLGSNPEIKSKRRRDLERMYRNFQDHPQITLDRFYQTCESLDQDSQKSSLQLISPNVQILSQDLTELFTPCALPSNIPLFILGTTQDKIVPPSLIYDNFASAKNVHIDFYQAKGHHLGYDYSQIVAKKILDFVNDASQR